MRNRSEPCAWNECILLGSPLIALSLDFSSTDMSSVKRTKQMLAALKERVGKRFSQASAKFIHGDCDDPTFKIGGEIAKRALTLCFVDPYSIDIHFSTICSLSQGRKIDFLCLLASRMDAGAILIITRRMNAIRLIYCLAQKRGRRLEEVLRGSALDRPGDFTCREFSRKMEGMGYLPTELYLLSRVSRASVQLYSLRNVTRKRHSGEEDEWLASTCPTPELLKALLERTINAPTIWLVSCISTSS